MPRELNFPNSDAATLMGQATMAAHDYLIHAKSDIDAIFGEGFAAAHAELVGAYLQTAALEFGTAVIARAVIDAALSTCHTT